MSTDGTPSTGGSLSARPLILITRLVLRFPVATLVLAIGLALASVGISFLKLQYRTSRLDLLNPKSDYNRLWIDYIKEFGAEDDAVVVVEGAGRDQVVPVLQEMAAVLNRQQHLFHAVLHKVDLEKIRSKGLHYLSAEDLLGIDRFLDEVTPIVQQHWSMLQIGQMTMILCQRWQQAIEHGDATEISQAAAEVERLTKSLLANLGPERGYVSPWPGMPQSMATLSELNSEYLLTKGGTYGFILLRLAPGHDTFIRGSEATDALRDLIAQTSANHPGVKIGLTGLPIMENDEMRSSESSMMWATIISNVGVLLLLIAAFGGLRETLLTNAMLMIGMAWSFGYATLVVGHLNILSVAFAATLSGLGIDYGVYYAARYMQLRDQHRTCHEALLETTAVVGPAILVGALTTAAGFFAAVFTSFKGVVELGLIAGGGVLLCAAAELFVLPAAILLMDRSKMTRRLPEPLAIHHWLAPLLRSPRLVLFAITGCTALIAIGVTHVTYDHNLLNLQATGLESVELERKLLAECNESMWYALSIADSREELLERKEKLQQLASVERTQEIVSLLPADLAEKQPIIERIQKRLADLPERPPLIPLDSPAELGQVFAQAQLIASRSAGGAASARQLEQIRDRLRRLSTTECYSLVSEFQQQTAGDLLSRLYTLKGVANPEPPKLTDLPASLVDRFVGQHGKHLLRIYGRGNIWDMEALSRFVKDVRSVDPRATGNPLQAYEASLEMKGSYERATLYALLVILGLLYFDCRSIRWSLLAALPLAVGVLQMFGLLGLLHIPLNPANIIAIPIILGVGVDYGLHVVYDYRNQRGRYQISPSTALAVMVDALTTAVGFGSLMIARHQGLMSLGRVLTIGVTCCMFTSLVLLPAFLTWISRNRPQAPAEEPPLEFKGFEPRRSRSRDRDSHEGEGVPLAA